VLMLAARTLHAGLSSPDKTSPVTSEGSSVIDPLLRLRVLREAWRGPGHTLRMLHRKSEAFRDLPGDNLDPAGLPRVLQPDPVVRPRISSNLSRICDVV